MGIFKGKWSSLSSFDSGANYQRGYDQGKTDGQEIAKVQALNPNPDNYNIVKHERIGKTLIILINYPDAKNYEGNKILVFDKCTLIKLLKQKTIDPHFSNNKNYLSPIARFEPTEYGWELARAMAILIKQSSIFSK